MCNVMFGLLALATAPTGLLEALIGMQPYLLSPLHQTLLDLRICTGPLDLKEKHTGLQAVKNEHE